MQVHTGAMQTDAKQCIALTRWSRQQLAPSFFVPSGSVEVYSKPTLKGVKHLNRHIDFVHQHT